MNISDIDWLFENIFAGSGAGYPEDEGPEPLNKRFSWVDPKTGKKPPKPPKAMLPGEKEFQELEQTHAVPPTHGEPGSVNVPIKHVTPPEEGRYSLADLIPPEELATIDQLLDLKLRAMKARGAEQRALEKEYQAHSSEFESLIKKVVDVILEANWERHFNRTMKSLHGVTDRVNQDVDKMYKTLPAGKRRTRPATDKNRAERGAGPENKFGE